MVNIKHLVRNVQNNASIKLVTIIIYILVVADQPNEVDPN